MGPGTYDVTKSMNSLKPRQKSINFAPPEHSRLLGKKTERLNIGSEAAPDSKYEPRPFGSDVKSFKIGRRSSERPVDTPGPGNYKTDMTPIKTRNPTFKIESGPARPDNFTRVPEYRAEPGLYFKQEKFAEKAPSFKIS